MDDVGRYFIARRNGFEIEAEDFFLRGGEEVGLFKDLKFAPSIGTLALQ